MQSYLKGIFLLICIIVQLPHQLLVWIQSMKFFRSWKKNGKKKVFNRLENFINCYEVIDFIWKPSFFFDKIRYLWNSSFYRLTKLVQIKIYIFFLWPNFTKKWPSTISVNHIIQQGSNSSRTWTAQKSLSSLVEALLAMYSKCTVW